MFSLTWGSDGIRLHRREGNESVGHSHDRKRLLRTSGAVILAVLAAGLMLGACSSTPKAAANNSTSTTTSPKSTSTTVAPTTTTTIPFAVAQVKSGTGPASLAQFTVTANAKEWDLDWEYDCTKTPAKTGSFAVTVVGHGSSVSTTDAGVPQQSGHGTAGLVKNFDTGTFNLNVSTTCAWTVRVEITT
jgi:hypothetical protein